jgi:hypothetical protein
LEVLDETGLLAVPGALIASDAFILVHLLVSQIPVDHVLPQRHEVELRTHEFGMSCLAVGTLEDLELIQFMFRLIT